MDARCVRAVECGVDVAAIASEYVKGTQVQAVLRGLIRRDPDARSVFVTLQVANGNRLDNVRRLRDETRALHRALAAEPGAR